MTARHLPAALLMVLCATPCCAHLRYDNPTGKPISFTPHLGKGLTFQTVRKVSNDYRRMWLLFYLLPIGRDGTDMIGDTLGGADGMVNLTVTSQWDFIDVLVTNLTFGLFCTRKVMIEGDLVAINESRQLQPAVDGTDGTEGADPSAQAVAAQGGTCVSCGADTTAGTRFCASCRGSMQRDPPVFCHACGVQAPARGTFCAACGVALHRTTPVLER